MPRAPTRGGSGPVPRTPRPTSSRAGRSPPTPPTPASSAARRCTGRPRRCGCCPRTSRCARCYGEGADWPLTYEDLTPFYNEAEREIGVSADVEDQAYLGITFDEDYVFPMKGLPLSYLDQMVGQGRRRDAGRARRGAAGSCGSGPSRRAATASPIPPTTGAGATSRGARSAPTRSKTGGRCQGNNNCVPICPVQAKYHAGKTLALALQSGRVDLRRPGGRAQGARRPRDPPGRRDRVPPLRPADSTASRRPGPAAGCSCSPPTRSRTPG